MTIALALALALLPQSSKPDPVAELDALQKEFGAARQSFFAELHKKQMAGEEVGPADFAKNPAKEFLPKFEALAERTKGTETDLKALLLVLELASETTGSTARTSSAIDAAFERHLNSPGMELLAQLLPKLHSGLGEESQESFLRRLIVESPHANVRLAAKFNLAVVLERIDSPMRKRMPEAKQLFHAVIKEGDGTRYAELADTKLFALENLQVGRIAPEIAAKDQDGKDFKLSDHRGKVVVLDFWGFW